MHFKIDGLAIQQETDRATVYTLATGDNMAVVTPPALAHGDVTYEENRAMEAVRTAMNGLAAYDGAVRRFSADKSLSDHGRDQAVSPVRGDAGRAVANAEVTLDALTNTVSMLEAEIFNLKPLDPGNAVAALEDMEIRQAIRGAGGKDREAFIHAAAENARIQDAVLRSAVPLPMFTDIAQRARAERVTATDPRMPQLTRARESLAWAKSIVPAVAARLK